VNRHYAALSGIAITLIVLNHAIQFGLQVSPVEGGGFRLLAVLQSLGAFAVPVFFFISGAFTSYSAPQQSLAFLRASLVRVLWPYVIWATMFYVMLLVAGDGRYALGAHLRNLVVGNPYHFVPLLLFWYVTAPILIRLARRHPLPLLGTIAIYQVFLISIRFPEVFGLAESWNASGSMLTPPVLYRPMSDWAVYFPLGLVLSLHDARARSHLRRWRWTLASAAAVLFLLGVLDGSGAAQAPWARFLAPLSLMFVLPVVSRTSIPLLSKFETLGRESYGIYLSHLVVINLTIVLVQTLDAEAIRNPFVVFPMFFLVALLIPLRLMDLIARTRYTRGIYRYAFGSHPRVTSSNPSRRLLALFAHLPRASPNVERPT
jgi:fucose 4-O-acetylase-like acetyltransferase